VVRRLFEQGRGSGAAAVQAFRGAGGAGADGGGAEEEGGPDECGAECGAECAFVLADSRPVPQAWRRIIQMLLDHSLGFIFATPVDPVALGIPDYFNVVKKPMDLGTVLARLETGEIVSPSDFGEHVRRVFANAQRYNKDSENPIRKAADELKSEFEAEWSLECAAQKRRDDDANAERDAAPPEEGPKAPCAPMDMDAPPPHLGPHTDEMGSDDDDKVEEEEEDDDDYGDDDEADGAHERDEPDRGDDGGNDGGNGDGGDDGGNDDCGNGDGKDKDGTDKDGKDGDKKDEDGKMDVAMDVKMDVKDDAAPSAEKATSRRGGGDVKTVVAGAPAPPPSPPSQTEEPVVPDAPRMGEAAKQKCALILDAVLATPYAASLFAKPVDPVMLGIADYLTIVKRPMDLGTVLSKLNVYSNMDDFADDVRLVFSNAKLYNVVKKHPVHVCATACERELEKELFERALAELPSNEARVAQRCALANQDKMKKLAAEMLKKDSKRYFDKPVDLMLYTDYTQIVERPLDVSTISSRVAEYGTLEAFADDMRLVYENAMLYVPDVKFDVHVEAKRLLAALEVGLRRQGVRAAGRSRQRKRPAVQTMQPPQQASKFDLNSLLFSKGEDGVDLTKPREAAQFAVEDAVEDVEDVEDARDAEFHADEDEPPAKKAKRSSSPPPANSPPPAKAERAAPSLPRPAKVAVDHLDSIIDDVFDAGDPIRIVVSADGAAFEARLKAAEGCDWSSWGAALSKKAASRLPDDDRLELLWASSRSESVHKCARLREAAVVRARRIAEAQVAEEQRQADQVAEVERRRIQADADQASKDKDEERRKKDADAKRAAARASARRERAQLEQTVDLDHQRLAVSSFLETIDADNAQGFDQDDAGD